MVSKKELCKCACFSHSFTTVLCKVSNCLIYSDSTLPTQKRTRNQVKSVSTRNSFTLLASVTQWHRNMWLFIALSSFQRRQFIFVSLEKIVDSVKLNQLRPLSLWKLFFEENNTQKNYFCKNSNRNNIIQNQSRDKFGYWHD